MFFRGQQSLFASLFQCLLTPNPASAAPPSDVCPEADVRDTAALEDFVGNFDRLVSGMEERFVPLGDDLGKIVRHLQSLAKAAGDGFGAIREEISSGSLGELDVRAQSALNSLREQLSTMSDRLRPLADVSDDLGRLRLLGSDVHRIGASLIVCGSSFAVESARTEASRIAFAAFVEDLRDLAKRIAVLSDRMDQDSHATLAQLNAARLRIRDNLDELERLAHTMRGAFATASGEIQQLLGGMRSVLERVERHRLAIARQTGGVIYYLQFGDLVRQKCEHVLTAAREARESVGDAADANYPILVRTSVAQLELIQKEVDEARSRLADGYAGLNDELAQLAGCGRALNDSGHGAKDDAWARLKGNLRDLEAIQQKEARLNLDAVQTANEAGAASAALQAGLGSVREMSSHLHLLALNAIIQTVHLGEGGRALEELAQHVDSLHRTCDQLVPQVVEVLETIVRRVDDFAGRAPETAALDLDGLRQLERAQERSKSVMQQVLGLAAEGEEMLRAAVGRLTTLDLLSTEISLHRAALQRIAEQLPAVDCNAAPSEADARMLERYTMQTERDAHQRARGIAVAAAVPVAAAVASDPFELCRPQIDEEPATAMASAPTGDADLGDNIELF